MRWPLERRAIWQLAVSEDLRKVGGHLVWLAGPYLQSLIPRVSFARRWTIPTSPWHQQSWGPGFCLSSDRSTRWSPGNWAWVIPILLSPSPQPGAFWSGSELKAHISFQERCSERRKQRARASRGLGHTICWRKGCGWNPVLWATTVCPLSHLRIYPEKSLSGLWPLRVQLTHPQAVGCFLYCSEWWSGR